ncbi:MAG: TonB-dependent receptor [Caldimonas sp.]
MFAGWIPANHDGIGKVLIKWRVLALVLPAANALFVVPAPAFAQRAPASQTLPAVEVIGTTPLAETGTALNQIPANVTTLRSGALAPRRALDLSDALNQGVGAASLGDTTGNPFQPDFSYRGFAASPVLGTPQGISVFVDGVRVNEAFGDTVNWDLIAPSSIRSVTLMPGSNPVFGLNTLGGAVSVRTKDGFSNPGVSISGYGGSFGRRALDVEVGGKAQSTAFFVAASALNDDGWGDHNPSRIRHLFAKAGYEHADTRATVSVTMSDNHLEGNQTLPLSFLADFRQAYTYPDAQTNRLMLVNATFVRTMRDDLSVSGNVYYRKLRTYVINSNVNDDFDRSIGVAGGNEPTGNAINRIAQYRPGGTLQLTSLNDIAGHSNHAILGVSGERGRVDFAQLDQEGGATRDTSSSDPLTLATSLRAVSQTTGVFAADTFGIDARTWLTASARYDHTAVHLRDRIGTALNGDHVFHRLDPAIGLTHETLSSITTYVSLSQGMRIPSPVELGCADADAPCSLPNAFAADPALKAVVSNTFEIGVRSGADAAFSWSAAVFETRLKDDIQFTSSGGGANSAGYFRNVGSTRRQGFELGVGARTAAIHVDAHYSYIDATYRTPFILNSPNNSTAEALTCPTCADIAVRAGDHIPGTPKQRLKLRGEYTVGAALAVGGNLFAQGRSYARGDENNSDINGQVPGFAVVNLDGRLRLAQGWELFARATNVLDRRYSTFGTLGRNVFTEPGGAFDASGATWRAEQFRSSGPSRGIWLGLSYVSRP